MGFIKGDIDTQLPETPTPSLIVSPPEDAIVLSLEQRNTIETIVAAATRDNMPGIHLVTGKPGTGKSVILRTLFQDLQVLIPGRVLSCAPTGTSALNIDGMTIHRLMSFGIDHNVTNVANHRAYKAAWLRALIIDEISMVRADLLDMIDIVLRNTTGQYYLPFGGIVVIMFGDAAQLPPVVTTQEQKFIRSRYDNEYFFSSGVFKECLDAGCVDFYELTEVFRQKGPNFLKVLEAVRSGKSLKEVAAVLNEKCGISNEELFAGCILTKSNRSKDAINQRALARIPGEAAGFEALIRGNLKPHQISAPVRLELKEGARVMCIKNLYEGYEDIYGRMQTELSLANGDLGTVLDIGEDAVVIEPDRFPGSEMVIRKEVWEEGYHDYDTVTKKAVFKSLGFVTQLPLALATAMTIHKAQGKSLDECTIDVRDGMGQAGMLYTALTRARSSKGLRILGKLNKFSFTYDPTITKFNLEVSGKSRLLLEEGKEE